MSVDELRESLKWEIEERSKPKRLMPPTDWLIMPHDGNTLISVFRDGRNIHWDVLDTVNLPAGLILRDGEEVIIAGDVSAKEFEAVGSDEFEAARV